MEPEVNPAAGTEGSSDPRAQLASLISSSEDGSIGGDAEATPDTAQDEQETDAPAQEEPAPEPEFTVKVDGKEFRVKQSELISGYQRDSDYRAKTMALAEERRAAESAKTAAAQRVQQLDDALSHVISRLEVESTSTAELEKLLETNPQEYLKQRHALETKRAELAQARIAQHQLREQQMAEMHQAQARFVEEERVNLLRALPEWKDEAKAKAEKGQLAEYLRSYGFSNEQLNGLTDHRDVLIARKAMLYDNLLKQKPLVDKKVQSAPPRAESPNASQGNSDRKEKFGAAMKVLNKTGSREAGRAAIRALLG